MIRFFLSITTAMIFIAAAFSQQKEPQESEIHPDVRYAEAQYLLKKANGFKGIWYMNQPSNDKYVYKYSGGMGTYPANHRPFAIYAAAVDKTFFCFGGTDSQNSTLLHNVSYYDHRTGRVANPTIVLDKRTTDAHDNPVISIDNEGYIWLFSTSHGTSRPSYISRSSEPYSIDKFEQVRSTELENGVRKPFDNFSYFQVYHLADQGFIALFTKYKNGQRVIGFNTSADGETWNEWQVLAHIEEGHYQVSAERNGKIAVAFDYHPKGKGLNYRTNLYYLETVDFGETWRTASGEQVALPLTDKRNAALVNDYSDRGSNSYLLDIALDDDGRPFILTIVSKGYQAGPDNDPRTWTISSFDGEQWANEVVTSSDSNYDMGSVYLGESGKIRVVGPTEAGPQAYNPGGEVAVWESAGRGKPWTKIQQLTQNSNFNHNYVRRPRNHQPGFYGIWADGHGRKPSPSNLYFLNEEGRVFKLPYRFDTDEAEPEPLQQRENKADHLTGFPPFADPEMVGTLLVKRFIAGSHSQYGNPRPAKPPVQITYPDVCAWLGGLWFAKANNDQRLLDALEKRFLPLMSADKHLQPAKNHVDNNVFGAIPLELYRLTVKPEYRDLGLAYADAQWRLPDKAKPEEKIWAEKGYSWQTRIWIDDMFMITALQSRAYLATENAAYIDRAATEMLLYLDRIQQPNGLFFHAPEVPYFWARGNGWMAVGMTELLRALEENHPARSRILEAYRQMMGTLKKYQAPDGMWRQLIDDSAAWNETSGTAMFTYAMIMGVKNGWLQPDEYGPVARDAWLQLVSYINDDGEVTAVCEGTNAKSDRGYYLERKRITGDLHGQAPVIWCAFALLGQ